MKKTIYIFSNGELKRKGNTIFFEKEDGSKKYLPVENTNEFMIFGEVTLNKKLIDFLSQKEIILHFFNYYGYYSGSYYPREHYNSGYMILKQAENYLDESKRLELAKLFVKGAILNIEKVLKYYEGRGISLQKTIESISVLKGQLIKATSCEEIMALEGNIRDIYYRSFKKIVKSDDFTFESRTKRPPENRLNALISFGNSLLYTIVLSEIYKTHLDPRIGFLHATNFRRFTLNLDVAEVFKPIIVDRLIFTLLNKEMIKKNHFDEKLKGVYLKEKGRIIFVEELEKRLKTTIKHPSLGKNVSYRRLIRIELYKIEKHLIGEKKYEPFVARW